MQIADFMSHYQPGRIVISPYGLAVIETLYDEPIKERPNVDGDGDCWPEGCEQPHHTTATIWVNGHGEETIEIDKLVPATPRAMAQWQFQGKESEYRRTHLERIEDSLEDLVKQVALKENLETETEYHEGKRRTRQL